jgi:hypothetical protein
MPFSGQVFFYTEYAVQSDLDFSSGSWRKQSAGSGCDGLISG